MTLCIPTYLNIYPKFLVQPVIYRKSLLTPFLSRSMCVPLPHSGDLFSLSFRVRSQASWHPSTIPPSCLLKLCIVSFALCLAGKGWFIHSFLHALDIPFAIHTLKSFLNIEMWIFFFFLSLSWVFCGAMIVFIPFCLELVNRRLFFPVSLWKGCLRT